MDEPGQRTARLWYIYNRTLRLQRNERLQSQEVSIHQEAEMRPLHWGVAAVCAACAVTGIAVFAQQSTPAPTAQEKRPEKAAIDKPVAEFKLPDLTHEKKEGEKP